jgi:DNA-binding PadR family transcriptional regulator
MHGYQLMQAISERTGGVWRVSAGAVYPTIAQLEDEGLVTTEESGGRRLVTITPEGRAELEERTARSGDPFAGFGGATAGGDLRDVLQELHLAARQVSRGGRPEQVEAARAVLSEARRSLYLILAEATPPAEG